MSETMQDLNDTEQIAKYIINLQDDLENIALYLKEVMDKVEILEKNKQQSNQIQIPQNINFDYIKALVESDTIERENKMKETITQNVLKNIPTQKNNQSFINIIIFTLLLVCLYLCFKG
ncbi:hypothetical protein [Helicobacter sp. MIT 14-3879]|uniref:hypothetical protein n=1 Tax=Helicobacter sp. MIT 14-3879 TaxID=2040649 RepID=UPI000E1F2495|nr:hypothetical protein [Helicobacter sp. MIT 14-3879]RDU61866.1 hypothetical protein CQA44_08025 [Helicobacter sp. MIT 14-3879]